MTYLFCHNGTMYSFKNTKQLIDNILDRHWCDVHRTYFEYDDNGWPNCLTQTN